MRQKRLGYLDSARGLAAIGVLLVHAISSFSQTNLELLNLVKFTKDHFDIGKIFLIIFFLTSGFVIPYSINGKGKRALKSFAISRFFRLYPVYWLSAILGFILYNNFSIAELLINLTMFQQFFGVENIIGLYWTLQIELIFYFLIAFTFAINKLYCKRFLFQISIAFLLIAVVMACLRNFLLIKLPLAVPLTLSIMYFGSFYRYYIIDGDTLSKKLAKNYLLVYLLLIPIISYIGYNYDFGFGESWQKYTLTYILGMMLFLLICSAKYSNVIMEYTGRISYSVYVFHPLVILVIQQLDVFNSFSGVQKVTSTLLLTVLFSHLTYLTIEKPTIDFGKRLRSRIL